ncbi:T3SS regulon translocated regulator ExsE family protein [Aeromonas jandaei]|uniref:T3SS regulon translocated regulator ExsE family protein n=1 Tax=Aeromonas jandaei TaxID=650 RepID=UPI003BA03DEE
MKIQESSASQLASAAERSAAERSATGCFAGRAVSGRDALVEPVPLAAALRRTLALSRAQEQMLDRLQQGEHKPLTERRIRLL